MAVSFDLFGTLVEVDRSEEPADAIAVELRECGVSVPDDWDRAYREEHVEAPAGAEVPLPAHVSAALASRGVQAPANAARRAVVAAFDPEVRTRDGAVEAVAAAREFGPVGILSNCSVPQLARRALIRSDVDPDRFDAVVTSVACGWRKPSARAFETCADRLDAPISELVHVGDDPRTDGGSADDGLTDAGGRAVLLSDVPLAEFPDWLEGRR